MSARAAASAAPGSQKATAAVSPSSIVRLSSGAASQNTAADRQSSLYKASAHGMGARAAMELADKLHQKAIEKERSALGTMEDPVARAMLMMLIAQADGILSSAFSGR